MSKIIQDINLGENIRKIRLSCGMTQSEVRVKLELYGRPMHRATYSHIEQGKRNLYVSDLIALAKIFNKTLDEIFEGLEPVSRYEAEK